VKLIEIDEESRRKRDQRSKNRTTESRKKQRNEARKGERERVAEKLEATRMVKLQ
jgi:hypothetical protein